MSYRCRTWSQNHIRQRGERHANYFGGICDKALGIRLLMACAVARKEWHNLRVGWTEGIDGHRGPSPT